MDQEQAKKILALDINDNDIQSVFDKRKAVINERLNSAPTEALKTKYKTMLNQLDEAWSVLTSSSQQPSSLSQTKIADLPGATPSYTQHGTVGESISINIGLAPGQTLAGRYEIKEQIGQGGMGVVFRAYDINRSEDIAVKVLLPGLLSNDTARERFLSEAKLSSQLSHPNIVNVFDVQNDGKNYFLTMELLEGQNLRQMMDARKIARQPFTEKEVIELTRTISDALNHAHKNTVHRDIKPENIWIDEEGSYKIMDFGIARLMRTSQMTQTGAAMGTAYYMAPEQLKGLKNIDGRADQYALGVLMYELLTGEIPAGRIKSVRTLHKEISKNTSNVIDKMLETSPDDRFGTMDEFSSALDKKGSGIEVPSINIKYLGIATVLILLIGGAVMLSGSAGLSELWQNIRPISAEEEQKHYREAIQLEGEVKGLSRRLTQAKKDLEARIKEGENNTHRLEGNIRRAREASDKQELKQQLTKIEFDQIHDQQLQSLTNRIIYDDSGMLELEGKLQVAQSLIKDKQYPQASETLKPIKTNLTQRLAQFIQAEEYQWSHEKLDAARKTWQTHNQQQKLQQPADIDDREQGITQSERLAGQGQLKEAQQQIEQSTKAYQQDFQTDQQLSADRQQQRNQQTKTQQLEKEWKNYLKKQRITVSQKQTEEINKLEKAEQNQLKKQDFKAAQQTSQQLQLAVTGYLKTANAEVNTQNQKRAAAKAEKTRKAKIAYAKSSEGLLEKYAPGMKLVKIPSGSFRMGDLSGGGSSDEKPVHKVKLKGFKLTKHEVTFAQYDAYVNSTGKIKLDDKDRGRGNQPVVNVNWNEANAYVKWLSQKTGLKFRLPSEAEWEYAARASSRTKYSWGNSVGNNNANCHACGSQWDGSKTAPVGSFKANKFGLNDIHGNVWEWVQDCWNDSYSGAPQDGSAWTSGDCSKRVLRGGSWYDRPNSLRSALRHRYSTDSRSSNFGFRVLQDP
jgi:formylglycine-generating enzyme required for sulfatase activity/serine/threonine protein kinase